MVATHDYIWEQGEDLIIEIFYRINNTPVDLTGYSVRMDIAPRINNSNGEAVWAFNTDNIEDPFDPDQNPDGEAVLNEEGRIHIHVSRALTLPGGIIGNSLTQPSVEYGYDLFLRTPDSSTQKKLLQGKIQVRKSITQWA